MPYSIKGIRIRIIVLLSGLLILLILGEIDVALLKGDVHGLDQNQWWIFTVVSISSVMIYYGGKPISRFLFSKPVTPNSTTSFEIYHIIFWWGLLTIIAITLFYYFPENRSYVNEMCLASFSSLMIVVFSWLVIVAVIRRGEISLSKLLPLLIIGYIVIGIAFGAITYDLGEIHGQQIIQWNNNSYATFLFMPIVTVIPIKDVKIILSDTCFEWFVLLFWLGSTWTYRFLILASLTKAVSNLLDSLKNN